MKQFDDLQKHIAALKGDFEKFYENKNQTAGVRVRKGMQKLKGMAQEIRVEVKDERDKYKQSKGQI